MSLDIEYSTDNLLVLLRVIKEDIERGNLSEAHKEHIWNSLLWDTNKESNKELSKYLFIGWYLSNRATNSS